MSDLQQRLRDYYRMEGEAYHHQAVMHRGYFHARIRHWVWRLLAPLPGQTLLEVGCAEGWYVRALAQQGASAVGVDLSWPKLKRAAAESTALSVTAAFLQADAEALPFADDSFDGILCSEVLEHLLHPGKALEEMRRVTRRYVIVSVPNARYYRRRRVGSLSQEILSAELSRPGKGHLHEFTPGSLARTVERAGLSVEQMISTCFRFPFRRLVQRYLAPLEWPLRVADHWLADQSFLWPFAYHLVAKCRK